MKRNYIALLTLFAVLSAPLPVFAELLCAKVVTTNGTAKIQPKTVSKLKCPKGYVKLIDTSVLVGPQGAEGPAGVGIGGTLESGATIVGYVGERVHPTALNQNNSAIGSFGVKIPSEITAEKVVVKATQTVLDACGGNTNCLGGDDITNQSSCTGTFDTPTAAPGFVCIYPNVASNVANNLQGFILATDNRFGFQLFWTSSNLDTSLVGGSWAYTAP